MLIVAVEFRVTPDKRMTFAALARDLEGPTRQEDGCRFFEFWSDLDETGRFLVFEGWESMAHLEVHRETAHVAVFKSGATALGIESMEAQRWTATEPED